MYQSIVRLFGCRSAASSRSRVRRKNPGWAFRPALQSLEVREVMSVAGVVGPMAQLVVLSSQPAPEPGMWPEGYRPVAPKPPGAAAPDVVSGPAQPVIWYDPPIGAAPPNTNSGPTTSPLNPNGPEPYRITAGGADVKYYAPNGSPVGLPAGLVPVKVEVKGAEVTITYANGIKTTFEQHTVNNVTTTTTTLALGGVKYGQTTVAQPGKTTIDTYYFDKDGHPHSVRYSEDDGTKKTEWVKNPDGMYWTKTVYIGGVAGKSEPSAGPPSH